MKARIAQLELSSRRAAVRKPPRRGEDAKALRSAEGGDAPIGTARPRGPAAAAAPAPPEIAADHHQIRSWAFATDMTNDGGHNADSPMSTKYFTPEIRFDATTFSITTIRGRYDGRIDRDVPAEEFQLEQASFGGDIRSRTRAAAF